MTASHMLEWHSASLSTATSTHCYSSAALSPTPLLLESGKETKAERKTALAKEESSLVGRSVVFCCCTVADAWPSKGEREPGRDRGELPYILPIHFSLAVASFASTSRALLVALSFSQCTLHFTSL